MLEIVVHLADLQSSFICSRNDGVVRNRQYVACYSRFRVDCEHVVECVHVCMHRGQTK